MTITFLVYTMYTQQHSLDFSTALNINSSTLKVFDFFSKLLTA